MNVALERDSARIGMELKEKRCRGYIISWTEPPPDRGWEMNITAASIEMNARLERRTGVKSSWSLDPCKTFEGALAKAKACIDSLFPR